MNDCVPIIGEIAIRLGLPIEYEDAKLIAQILRDDCDDPESVRMAFEQIQKSREP